MRIYYYLQGIFKKSSLLRYVFIGGTSYLIELGCIFILNTIINSPVIAVGIGFWLGLGVSFLLQKVFAFKNTSKNLKQLSIQSFYYLLLVAFNYSFTLLLVWQLSNHIGLFSARTIALIVTTIWNYFLYKNVIFKQKPTFEQ